MSTSTVANNKPLLNLKNPTVTPDLVVVPSTHRSTRRTALISRTLDFWLLGGFSIAAWLVILIAHQFKSNLGVERHIQNLPYAMSLLTLFCNHPHFISSYKFGYTRGSRFILKNWFALIIVPLGLLSLLTLSYFAFIYDVEVSPWVADLNGLQRYLPIHIDLGADYKLGSQLLALSVWIMWMTVGWHYAKQVFGCMMVNAAYDNYSLSRAQRTLLKWNLLFVAVYAFSNMTLRMKWPGSSESFNFQGLSVMGVTVDSWVAPTSIWLVAISGLSFLSVLVYNFFQSRQLPSLNFLVSGIAFYIWWYPGLFPIEYAALVVPFFHSLQYLPFSYKMIEHSTQKTPTQKPFFGVSIQIVTILIIGAFMFDIGPTFLDDHFSTNISLGCMFFAIASAVFINVHHFFIDSVIWKSNHDDFRKALL